MLPGFPRQLALMTLFPARAWLAPADLDTTTGLTLTALAREPMDTASLTGQWIEATGVYFGETEPRFVDRVELTDSRFIYAAQLETSAPWRERGRDALRALTATIQPIPGRTCARAYLRGAACVRALGHVMGVVVELPPDFARARHELAVDVGPFVPHPDDENSWVCHVLCDGVDGIAIVADARSTTRDGWPRRVVEAEVLPSGEVRLGVFVRFLEHAGAVVFRAADRGALDRWRPLIDDIASDIRPDFTGELVSVADLWLDEPDGLADRMTTGGTHEYDE
jgi:hypothetical protein